MYTVRAKYYRNGTISVATYSTPIRSYGKTRYKGILYEDKDLDTEIIIDYAVKDLKRIQREIGCKEEVDPKKEADNLKRSLRHTKNMIIDYGRDNIWEYFVTFTFSPDKVNREDYALLSKKIRKWFDNQKERTSPDGKYLIVPELHSDGKSFHFHALVSGFNFDMVQGTNAKTGLPMFDKKGRPIYNIKNFKYGFTTCTAVTDTKKAVSYLLKYITKDLCTVTKGKHRYYVSKNCTLPLEQCWFELDENKYPEIVQGVCDNYGVKVTHSNSCTFATDSYENHIVYYELE